MSQALATKIEDMPLAPATFAPSPLALLSDAIQKGMSIDVIREIKSMAKEMADEEAARAFSVAFAAFKAEVVTVIRGKEVTDGPLKGRKYAELHSFVDAATPALAKHGLSHSWSVTRDEKDWIEVTCVLEHSLGGKKQVSQGGPPDSGGAKNPLQARISTVTYLERATLKAVTGLAEKGDDDDGGGVDTGELISDEQRDAILKLIDEVGGSAPVFCKYFKIAAVSALPAAQYDRAIAALEAKRAK